MFVFVVLFISIVSQISVGLSPLPEYDAYDELNCDDNSCIYDRCVPTCNVPNPPNCFNVANYEGRCNCENGYILSEEGGECVKTKECQNYLKCNDDRNATYSECANPCVSTCSNPNATPCRGQCEPGCQCNPLYVLSDEGKCISPDDCPGGNPCGQNKTFIYCNVKCPRSFCPVNDNRGMIACDPPYPCPSGCSCLPNYKYLSANDDRCILATDCPPVNCTRQNEVWNSCPPPCLTESCRDINSPPRECIRSGPDCQPQCVCRDGYRRNDSDICVPVSECYCPVNEKLYTCGAQKCTRSCFTLLDPNSCPEETDCLPSGCDCQDGYLRNAYDRCVLPNRCFIIV